MAARADVPREQLVTRPVALDALYHVPRSQVWAGSRGRQQGHVHLHVLERIVPGGRFTVRQPGRALCLARGWYERPREEGEQLCPRCVQLAELFGLEVPS